MSLENLSCHPLHAPPSAGYIESTLPVIRFDTLLGLSPLSLAILFRERGTVPCRLVTASTLLISAIQAAMTSPVKLPMFRL